MQVAERIRVDSRLTIKERTNLRYITLGDMPGRHAASTLVLYRLSFRGKLSAPVVSGSIAALAHCVLLCDTVIQKNLCSM